MRRRDCQPDFKGYVRQEIVRRKWRQSSVMIFTAPYGGDIGLKIFRIEVGRSLDALSIGLALMLNNIIGQNSIFLGQQEGRYRSITFSDDP